MGMTLDEMRPQAKMVAEILDDVFEYVISGTGAVHVEAMIPQSGEFAIVQSVWDTVAPLGLAICIFYFLLDLNRILLQEGSQITMKSFGNPLLKLGCGFAFIQYGDDILVDVMSYGGSLVSWMAEGMTTGGSSTFLEEMHEIVNGFNFWGLIGLMISAFALWVVSLIVGLVIDFKMMILKYEIMFRVAFAPIALGDIFEGKQSHALRYIKKILACFTYGAGMIFVVKIGSELALGSIAQTFAGVTFSPSAGVGLDANNVLGEIMDAYVNNAVGGLVTPVILIKSACAMLLVPIGEIGAFGLIKQASNDVWGC